MPELDHKNTKRYLGFLWLSAILISVVAPVTAVYAEQISQSNFLIILILLVMVPAGMTYLSLLIDIVKVLKLWLLFLIPLVFFPRIFVLLVGVGPLVYLVFLTYRYRRIMK